MFIRTLGWVAAVSTFFPITASAQAAREPQPMLTGPEAATFLARHKGPILDVRESGDCDAGSLAGTTQTTGYDLGFDDPDVRRAADDMFVERIRKSRVFVQVNRNQTLVLVVCCGGGRSSAAATAMAARGFNVVSLDGGLRNPALPAHLLVKQ